MQTYITACPRNCYSTCTMKVHVENGRLLKIEPYPQNKATPEGPCLKGLSYVERVHSPARLLHPLRRVSDAGDFQKISWNEAFDFLAEKFMKIKEDFSPQSILYYAGSGTKGILNEVGMNFWRLFGGCTTTYGDLCWPAGLEATRLTLGDNKHNAPWDLGNARLIVIWGKNPAETNIHQMVFVHQALENGAKLVVIDPRRSETAERAHLLIQPRPGTDGALALGLANQIVRRNWIDSDFIDRHVKGFEAFRQLINTFPPSRAAAICDVPESQIVTLAEWFGTIKPATISAGFGMQRYTNSGQTLRAMIALLAITGNIGKPGAGWQFANLQSHVFSPEKDPLAFYPPQESDGVIRVAVSTAKLGQDLLRLDNPPIKAIWVERGNPISQNPETPIVLRAFRQLNVRVVIDQFLTDTAREADVILPAKTMFEQTDVINAYWHPYIQLKRKVLDPPGEVKPESEIYYHLARRLGFSESELQGRIPAPGEENVRAYLAQKLAEHAGITLDELEKGPILPPTHEEVAFSDYRFPTPSGKIELYSDEARERWGQDPLPIYKEPIEAGDESCLKKEYPLLLMTPNTQYRIHSQFNNLQMIRQFNPKPIAALHPADAARRGIRPGDRVRIFNQRGELVVEAKIDFGLRPGCMVIHNGWWLTDGGAVNLLSLGRETDMGYGAAFHENRVQVEKIREPGGES